MKRLSMALALMLVLGAGSAWAQDVPKVEVFGGGSILNVRDGGGELTAKGWTAQVNGNMNKTVGIVGDIGGYYKHGFKIHDFLGGVQLTHRVEKVSAFAQAKAGIAHTNDSSDNNNFALGFGGGVDWNVNPNVAIRVFQIDWSPIKEAGSGGEWIKNIFRGSIGVVWKSGPR